MLWRILLLIAWGVGSQYCCAWADDGKSGRLEKELISVLRWEILWNDIPQGFRPPITGVAQLSLNYRSNLISYCSHQLGVCAEYIIEPNRNWQRNRSRIAPPGESDQASILGFVGASESATGRVDSPRFEGRTGSLGGTLSSAASGVFWTATLILGSRTEILGEYRRKHPPEIESLKNWLSGRLRGAGYKSVTIPCFDPADPSVFVYGDRGVMGAIVFAVYWDKEREKWVEAGLLRWPEDRNRIEEMRNIVQSIACTTVVFD